MINNLPPIDQPRESIVAELRNLADQIEKGKVQIKTLASFVDDKERQHTVIISKWDLAYALCYLKNDIEAAGISPGPCKLPESFDYEE